MSLNPGRQSLHSRCDLDLLRECFIMHLVARSRLDELENQSIFIFREAYHGFKGAALSLLRAKKL